MKRIMKVWFLLLVMLTVISVALAILHTINYRRHREERIQKWIDRGFTREFIKAYLDCFPPRWHDWGIGPLVICLNIITGVLWIVSAITVGSIKKEN